MTEIVYILTNPTIPDLVKIGRTTNLEERMKTLSSHSGIPVPFECYYGCEVEDGQDVERRLHFGFGDHRVNPKREFFRINPERVKMILEGFSLKDVTPTSDVVEDDQERDTLNRERSRRPVFRFSMVDIEIGSELTFLKDENLTCRVVSDREIEFDGTTSSLSQVTLDLLNNRFGKNWRSVRGQDFWIYENETLQERRLRMENEEPESKGDGLRIPAHTLV
jgi:hypothetical protein